MTSSRAVFDTTPGVRSLSCGRGKIFRYALVSCIAVSILAFMLLRWGSHLLVSDDDPLPSHIEGAVVLQGSVLGEEARIAGAVRLLEKGTTPRILVSIPKETYWGQPVAPLAYGHLEKIYGKAIVDYIDFCETTGIDSTEQEAQALANCIKEHGWHSVAVVTSDYHTRRAGIIWRKIFRQQYPSIHPWMHAVPDPEFYPQGWWRDRRSAKTWLLEFTKLVWTLCGQD